MVSHNKFAVGAQGFQGTVAGLSLADVIQLNDSNRFSGCITVQYEDQTGRIFFREGRTVHAEQGDKSGEQAFYDILEWSSGHFSLEPNVSTTSHTIKKSSQFMLLEAHRLIDERRAGRRPASESERDTAPPTVGGGATSLAERVSHLPGIACAVRMDANGSCVEETTAESESLAGRAAYLALIANRIGSALRAGQLHCAAIHGTETPNRVLLLVGKAQSLALLVDARTEITTVEAGVRKALNSTR